MNIQRHTARHAVRCGIMFAALAVTTVAARAGIVITLDTPDESGSPGSTLQYFGTISNTGAGTVYLNADAFNFSGGTGFAPNDLFNNVPLSLDAGTDSGHIELFDISVVNPFVDPFAQYGGSYQLLGGIDDNAQDVLASVAFSAAPAPEPVSSLLLLVGLPLIAGVRRLRHPGSPGLH